MPPTGAPLPDALAQRVSAARSVRPFKESARPATVTYLDDQGKLMKTSRAGLSLLALAVAVGVAAADSADKKDPREALKAFNNLIGSWRGTGEPEGTRAEKQRGFWAETISWGWQFKGDDAWLRIGFDKGKHLSSGELRYVPARDVYALTVITPAKETLTFEGKFENKRLTLERQDAGKKETQRLVFSFLHANRFLYRFEVKPAERQSFVKVYQVGATKKGVPFAGPGDTSPECVVSGGKGTMTVMYKGKTWYVCCSGCRAEFKENPAKYIKEYEARKAKEKSGP